jgi:hypothetical protein
MTGTGRGPASLTVSRAFRTESPCGTDPTAVCTLLVRLGDVDGRADPPAASRTTNPDVTHQTGDLIWDTVTAGTACRLPQTVHAMQHVVR